MSVFLQWKLQVEVVYEESFHCHTTGWFKMLRFHHKWQKDNWSFYNRSFGNWTLDNWSIYNSLNYKQNLWKNNLWQLIFDNWPFDNWSVENWSFDNWTHGKGSFSITELFFNWTFIQLLNFGQWSIRQLFHWTNYQLDNWSIGIGISNTKIPKDHLLNVQFSKRSVVFFQKLSLST